MKTHDPKYLFTLRLRVAMGAPLVIVDAFDGGPEAYPGTHHRIDVEVRQGGKVIFPRGATWCAVNGWTSIDGIQAKELVLSLVSMKPGDTDSDYFASYTPEQLA